MLTDDDILDAQRRFNSEVQRRAQNKWAHLFDDLVPEVAQAMHNAPFHVSCPVHGGADGFRLFSDYNKTGGGVCNTCGAKPNGLLLFSWIKEVSIDDAALVVDNWLKGNSPDALARRPPPPPPKPKVDPAVARQRIQTVLKGLLPKFKGTLGERYLISRGIRRDHMPTTVRTHPGLDYYYGKQNKFYGTFPALILPVRNAAQKLVSLHRIYLDPETGSKANVPDPKKMMSACEELRGCAIKLFDANGDTLGVAEGVETALAAHVVSQMPVWSCISATLLELVDIPDHVKTVVIWADLDVSGRGLEAAEKLATRLEKAGKRVEICVPPLPIPPGAKGLDWLDMLNNYGMNTFPAHWRRWRPADDA